MTTTFRDKLNERLQQINTPLLYLQEHPEKEENVREWLTAINERFRQIDNTDESFILSTQDDSMAFTIAAAHLAPFDIDTLGDVTINFLCQNGLSQDTADMLLGYFMIWFLGGAIRKVPLDRQTVAHALLLSGIDESKHGIIIGGFFLLIGYEAAKRLKLI